MSLVDLLSFGLKDRESLIPFSMERFTRSWLFHLNREGILLEYC